MSATHGEFKYFSKNAGHMRILPGRHQISHDQARQMKRFLKKP